MKLSGVVVLLYTLWFLYRKEYVDQQRSAIDVVLGCIAAGLDPSRVYWCANHNIETQA